MNLVIVEDSELVRYQLMRMCAEQDALMVVGVAETEHDAIALIQEIRPDAVLLDLSLATGTGLNVLRKIRAAGNAAHVVVLTNHTSEYFRDSCEPHGIAGFYDKSCETRECFALLNELALSSAGAQ